MSTDEPFDAEFKYQAGRSIRVAVGDPGVPATTVRVLGLNHGNLMVFDLSPDDAQELGGALIRAAEAARARTGGSGA